MTPEEVWERCVDEARALLELQAAGDPDFGALLEKHRDAIECGIAAGCSGTLFALRGLGVLS